MKSRRLGSPQRHREGRAAWGGGRDGTMVPFTSLLDRSPISLQWRLPWEVPGCLGLGMAKKEAPATSEVPLPAALHLEHLWSSLPPSSSQHLCWPLPCNAGESVFSPKAALSSASLLGRAPQVNSERGTGRILSLSPPAMPAILFSHQTLIGRCQR